MVTLRQKDMEEGYSMSYSDYNKIRDEVAEYVGRKYNNIYKQNWMRPLDPRERKILDEYVVLGCPLDHFLWGCDCNDEFTQDEVDVLNIELTYMLHDTKNPYSKLVLRAFNEAHKNHTSLVLC